MSAVARWKAEVRAQLALLSEVFADRFGYPFDAEDNFVSDAEHGLPAGVDGSLFPPALASFYADVGEVSLPDVNNGYFIHPADRLPESVARGLPVRVDVASIGAVATFGSDGGGGFFAVARGSGGVYHLPPGELVDGVYTGGLAEPVPIAADFMSFLQRLLVVIQEFAASGKTIDL